MKKGQLVRHRLFRDIDMYIVDVINESKEVINLRVKYWSRFYKFFLGGLDIVTVKKEDLGNWREVR